MFAPGVAWEALEAEAAAVAPAEGLVVLPYFQGERTPVWDERARAVFSGVDLTHGRGHLYRALLDGIALGFRHCLAVAEEHGVRFDEVVAANGAGRSALLRQTLADALGVPLVWASQGRGTAAGAALLAGLGAGLVASAVRVAPTRRRPPRARSALPCSPEQRVRAPSRPLRGRPVHAVEQPLN